MYVKLVVLRSKRSFPQNRRELQIIAEDCRGLLKSQNESDKNVCSLGFIFRAKSYFQLGLDIHIDDNSTDKTCI